MLRVTFTGGTRQRERPENTEKMEIPRSLFHFECQEGRRGSGERTGQRKILRFRKTAVQEGLSYQMSSPNYGWRYRREEKTPYPARLRRT